MHPHLLSELEIFYWKERLRVGRYRYDNVRCQTQCVQCKYKGSSLSQEKTNDEVCDNEYPRCVFFIC